MRIGVVCEGPTDFITMASFLSAELLKRELSVSFDIIQPALDNTLPGGWSQVFYWLEQNPITHRDALYKKGHSLFLNDDEDQKFDALIFQIDTDIIGEQGFETFVSRRGFKCIRPTCPSDRGEYVRDIINFIAGHASLDTALQSKEVPIALVESCETWIVAAASSDCDAESLTPSELTNRFGAVIDEQEGHPIRQTYSKINKKMKTRRRVCSCLSLNTSPATKAPHFDQAVDNICKVSQAT